MGKRGPAPIPTAILKSRGSWRANERKKEPQIAADKIEPPAWITKKGAEYWEEIAALLKPAGVLQNSDMPALGLLVESITRYLRYRDIFADKFKNNPVMIVEGKVVENPMANLVEKAHTNLVKMFKEFGMTPSSRAGIEVEPPVIIQGSNVVISKDKDRFFPE